MSDIETAVNTAISESTQPESESAPTPDPAPIAKKKAEPHACFCGAFELNDPADESGESTFTTGCESTTVRMFAQGHDARLVSFLVSGHADGYEIRVADENGNVRKLGGPVEAAALASPALEAKAAKALRNRETREAEKTKRIADREAAKARREADKKAAKEAKDAEKAAKAQAPREVPVRVADGSAEGDAVVEGTTRIKVGRHEYDATLDDEGTATYTDKSGAEHTIERDGYRLLTA